METLSQRIQNIIDTLSKKVSSMEESPQNCAAYTAFIEELYVLYNKVSRSENKIPPDEKFLEETNIFVIRIEKEVFPQS